jgi:hypothetical protein
MNNHLLINRAGAGSTISPTKGSDDSPNQRFKNQGMI